ncbi:YdbL family protein [Novosphingobium sp.]|uniref:YdbL family protein n=1 Tax=Novosphingobium sp. TaxID=1874826 RepID=UPI002FDE8147
MAREMAHRAAFSVVLSAAVALPLALSPASALAQRDPAYAAARAAGQVGEKMDGYLGYVTPPAPSLKAVVEDINLKRRAVYSEKAQAQKATVEEYAFTSGCLLIAQTQPGEKYQAPNGTWQTRTSAPPQRDSRCL